MWRRYFLLLEQIKNIQMLLSILFIGQNNSQLTVFRIYQTQTHVPPKNDGTGSHFQSIVCAKDINALINLIIEKKPRGNILPWKLQMDRNQYPRIPVYKRYMGFNVCLYKLLQQCGFLDEICQPWSKSCFFFFKLMSLMD